MEERIEEEEGVTRTPEIAEKTFTQEQVNEMVGRARKEGRESALRDLENQLEETRTSTRKEILERYGVDNEEEMDNLFGKGQQYDTISEENSTYGDTIKEKDAEIALLRSKIPSNRHSDVKAILGAKGLEVTPENIEMELATHPEWQPRSETRVEEKQSIRSLGTSVPQSERSEDTEMKRMRELGWR